jgi:hypothetical protein
MERIRCTEGLRAFDHNETILEAEHVVLPWSKSHATTKAQQLFEAKALEMAHEVQERNFQPHEYVFVDDQPAYDQVELTEKIDGRKELEFWVLDLVQRKPGMLAGDLNDPGNVELVKRWIMSDWVQLHNVPVVALWYHTHKWRCFLDASIEQQTGVKIPHHMQALWKTPQRNGKVIQPNMAFAASELFVPNECALCDTVNKRVMYQSSADSYQVCEFCIHTLSVCTDENSPPFIPMYNTLCKNDVQRENLQRDIDRAEVVAD